MFSVVIWSRKEVTKNRQRRIGTLIQYRGNFCEESFSDIRRPSVCFWKNLLDQSGKYGHVIMSVFCRICSSVDLSRQTWYKSEFTLMHYMSDIFGRWCCLNIHPLSPAQHCTTLWDYLKGLSPARQVLRMERRQLQLQCSSTQKWA